MFSPIWRCWSCRPLQVPLSETECSEVEHRVCEGLLHRGQHMHGALPISSGQRWNLIVWMRASQERNKLCPMCNKRPTLVEGEGFADGFTKHPATPNPSCALTWRADVKKAKRVEVSERRCGRRWRVLLPWKWFRFIQTKFSVRWFNRQFDWCWMNQGDAGWVQRAH